MAEVEKVFRKEINDFKEWCGRIGGTVEKVADGIYYCNLEEPVAVRIRAFREPPYRARVTIVAKGETVTFLGMDSVRVDAYHTNREITTFLWNDKLTGETGVGGAKRIRTTFTAEGGKKRVHVAAFPW